jgi:hypothetical protein
MFSASGNQMWGKAGYFAWQSGRPFEITVSERRKPVLSGPSVQPRNTPMASESTALSSDPAAAGKTEPPTPGEYPRSERRIPSARETLATLPELEADSFDFEPHDTIPAPPWLDDELPPPHKTP